MLWLLSSGLNNTRITIFRAVPAGALIGPTGRRDVVQRRVVFRTTDGLNCRPRMPALQHTTGSLPTNRPFLDVLNVFPHGAVLAFTSPAMGRRLRVLVVTQDGRTACGTRGLLRAAGYDVRVRKTLCSATSVLKWHPDLAIADVRLGAFNGLHLAIRALWADIPAIVIGGEDCVLQRDARAIGAIYVVAPIEGQAMLALVENLASMTLPRVSQLKWGTDETVQPPHTASPFGVTPPVPDPAHHADAVGYRGQPGPLRHRPKSTKPM